MSPKDPEHPEFPWGKVIGFSELFTFLIHLCKHEHVQAALHLYPMFLASHGARLMHGLQAHGMTAAELTAANLDRSAVLEDVIARAYGGDEAGLLGELQARCPQRACSEQCSNSCRGTRGPRACWLSDLYFLFVLFWCSLACQNMINVLDRRAVKCCIVDIQKDKLACVKLMLKLLASSLLSKQRAQCALCVRA